MNRFEAGKELRTRGRGTDAIAAGETEGAQGGKGDWIDGGDGADQLVGTGTADVLMGGDGQDILVGGGGDDILRGDSSRGYVGTNWSVTRQVTDNNGVTTYADVYNNATLNSTAGASDVLYGGAGDDWLLGEGGDDLLDGGDGADVLFGEEGNDTLLGRAGNDVLTGDAASTPEALQGEDFVDGGEGGSGIGTVRRCFRKPRYGVGAMPMAGLSEVGRMNILRAS